MLKRFKIYFSLVFIVFGIFSCKNNDGYIKSSKGFKFKMISENSEGVAISNDDVLTLELKYYSQSDSLLFNSDELPAKFRVQVNDSKTDGILQDALKMMKTGDSASFIIPAKDFYKKTKHESIPTFILPTENLRFEIKIIDIVSQYQLNNEFKQYVLIKEAEEKKNLKEYLSVENIEQEPTLSGIFIIKLKTGKGEKAENGKTVTINFVGKYINGKIFDSSLDKGKPLTFVLGDEHVIPAWNEAIRTMRVGDKIKLIAPSETAYGSEGIENYVPPFTTLIYEIKLLKVK